MKDLIFGPGDWVKGEWKGHLFEGEVWYDETGCLYVGLVPIEYADGKTPDDLNILRVDESENK